MNDVQQLAREILLKSISGIEIDCLTHDDLSAIVSGCYALAEAFYKYKPEP